MKMTSMLRKNIDIIFVLVLLFFFLIPSFLKTDNFDVSAQTCNTGDGDGDGDVDLNDYFYFWLNFGKNLSGPENGDFDCDNDIDLNDYFHWWLNFGTTIGTPTPLPTGPVSCGDGICSGPAEETCNTCQVDCGSCNLCPNDDCAICDATIHGPSYFSTNIDNEWFPLPDGMIHVLESSQYKVQFSVLPQTYTTAQGVVTKVIEEREWGSGGGLIEVSFNWFAQTQDGTVCYFGEDVCHPGPPNCGGGGSWEAGTGGAKAGIMMPPGPTLDMRWIIEDAQASGAFEDAILSAYESSFSTPYKVFNNVIYIVEDFGNSFKRYARGVGMIFDDGIKLIECRNNIACGQ